MTWPSSTAPACCCRVHGGAVPARALHVVESGVSEREGTRADHKDAIARAATDFVPLAGATVLFDAGTTTARVAALLPTDRELVVVTNSVPIAARVSAMPIGHPATARRPGPWADPGRRRRAGAAGPGHACAWTSRSSAPTASASRTACPPRTARRPPSNGPWCSAPTTWSWSPTPRRSAARSSSASRRSTGRRPGHRRRDHRRRPRSPYRTRSRGGCGMAPTRDRVMIVTVTPNPSIDRTVTLGTALIRGAVHRVQSVSSEPGGKGVNVARALTLAGLDAIAVLPAAPGDPFLTVLDARRCRRMPACRSPEPSAPTWRSPKLTAPQRNSTKPARSSTAGPDRPDRRRGRTRRDRQLGGAVRIAAAGSAGLAGTPTWCALLPTSTARSPSTPPMRPLSALAAAFDRARAGPDQTELRGTRQPVRPLSAEELESAVRQGDPEPVVSAALELVGRGRRQCAGHPRCGRRRPGRSAPARGWPHHHRSSPRARSAPVIRRWPATCAPTSAAPKHPGDCRWRSPTAAPPRHCPAPRCPHPRKSTSTRSRGVDRHQFALARISAKPPTPNRFRQRCLL